MEKNFPTRLKPRKLTKDETIKWNDFRKTFALEHLSSHIDYICKLYSDAFNVIYFKPDTNSSIMPVLKMIERIDLLIKK